MPIEVGAAQDALDRLIAGLPRSAAEVSRQMAHAAQRNARGNLEDPIGPLAESILTEGPDRIRTWTYRTRVGPTLVYGRQRELGGPIEPVNREMLTAHYRDPGYWTWDFGRGEEDVFSLHVEQFGQHYLKRGVESAFPELVRIARKVWGDMVRLAF